MALISRAGAWTVLVALAVALLATDLRASATPSGTPTPAGCSPAVGSGTTVASPRLDDETPVAGTPETLTGLVQLRAAFAAQGLQITTEETIEQEIFTAERITRLVVTGDALSGPAGL